MTGTTAARPCPRRDPTPMRDDTDAGPDRRFGPRGKLDISRNAGNERGLVCEVEFSAKKVFLSRAAALLGSRAKPKIV